MQSDWEKYEKWKKQQEWIPPMELPKMEIKIEAKLLEELKKTPRKKISKPESGPQPGPPPEPVLVASSVYTELHDSIVSFKNKKITKKQLEFLLYNSPSTIQQRAKKASVMVQDELSEDEKYVLSCLDEITKIAKVL